MVCISGCGRREGEEGARNESLATYPRPLLLIEWLRRRRSTGWRGGREEEGCRKEARRNGEGGRESALPRARHLISEIPNIFKSTGAGCSARQEEGRGGSRGAVVSPRPQRRTSLSTAIKIRIIIIRATAE